MLPNCQKKYTYLQQQLFKSKRFEKTDDIYMKYKVN